MLSARSHQAGNSQGTATCQIWIRVRYWRLMMPDLTWNHYSRSLIRYANLGFSMDAARMGMEPDWMRSMEPANATAMQHIAAIEAGTIVNTDENRQVGHYWLRNPALAPTELIRTAIENDIAKIQKFVADVEQGVIRPPGRERFTELLLIGIGGSALGPQLIDQALRQDGKGIPLHFLDNTDPGGFDRMLTLLEGRLEGTLVVVVSKSGKTPETANGMLEVQSAFTRRGIDFAKQAVAVTQEGSLLDQKAVREEWLDRFPMYDWVGGRTSVMSAVGLLPAALGGIDILSLLHGASAMDALTRVSADPRQNAALLLALAWHRAGHGQGDRDMVILPYCDRLSLMSKYLQQLVMESLGKEFDRDGRVVHQGISVYGNKGSTDQHAYVQQLREGPDNYFATFIEVRRTREQQESSILVDDTGSTSADYLQGFLRGTRQALAEKGHPSITISIPEVNATTVGSLIALYERAVSIYASFININAYHQPGVEAGKAAAGGFLAMLARVRDHLQSFPGQGLTAEGLANALGESDIEDVYHALTHLVANRRGFQVFAGDVPADDVFQFVAA